ncbi:MAG: hypothetical protein ACI8R4_003461 [Paracoccaceae bacterium]|jgi:hypothetical protein
MNTKQLLSTLALILAAGAPTAQAGGIISTIVNALSATGTVQGARTGINV